MIGIFGGTFDPVHYGHIKPALSVKQALNLEQLRFIPNRVPPHRDTPWLRAGQRLALLQKALQAYPDSVVDERELKRDGPSYMVDTLASLKSDFPDNELCLIIGMDAFFGITSWHQWRSVFGLCQMVVTTRPGFDSKQMQAHMNSIDYRFLKQQMTQDINIFARRESSRDRAKILIQSVPQLDISSTRLRQQLNAGEDISQWMPSSAYRTLRGFVNDNR